LEALKVIIPRHLNTKAKKFYKEIFQDFTIDDAAGRSLLLAAAEAYQRCNEAREIIKKSGGCVITDRFGQVKPHPAVSIERDARTQVIAALRALNLNPGDRI